MLATSSCVRSRVFANLTTSLRGMPFCTRACASRGEVFANSLRRLTSDSGIPPFYACGSCHTMPCHVSSDSKSIGLPGAGRRLRKTRRTPDGTFCTDTGVQSSSPTESATCGQTCYTRVPLVAAARQYFSKMKEYLGTLSCSLEETVRLPGQGFNAMSEQELSMALPALLPRLWSFALRLAADQDDAADLVQRACVRALERRPQLRPGSPTLSWLFSIVHSL